MPLKSVAPYDFPPIFPSFMGNTNQSNSLLVAQISDLHLFADERQDLLGWNTWKSLDVILQRLMALNPLPEIILLTGDLSQDETEGAYQRVIDRLTPLGIPTYWLPGNHDHVATMDRVLNQPPIYPDKVLERGGWKLLLLNSNVPGQVHGELSGESLQWLSARLSETPDNQPTLIALHHPPFWVGSPWLDQSGLQNTAEFLEIIDRCPQVRLVLFGHIHQEFEHKRHTVTYLSAPSTCIQFMPRSDSFALDDARPGFRLLRLHSSGQFETNVYRVSFGQQLNFAAQGY
jgi:3',5'-cyclic-AMP phosphodiesterase